MKRLWIALALVTGLSFAVLLWVGVRISESAPPIPMTVRTSGGRTVTTAADIEAGQNVWQALGGMELGSVWGHGSYVAPDWTADWLHREATFVLDRWSHEQTGTSYADLDAPAQASLRARLQAVFRNNHYDAASQTLTLDPARAAAFDANLQHYSDVFTNGRNAYALPAGTVTDPAKLRQLAAFFFWTAWAASTERPGDSVTYTNNWPHETLIGNQVTGDMIIWTGLSVLMLLAGLSAMVWWKASLPTTPAHAAAPPPSDPLVGATFTPSQRAVTKYFWVATALFLVQIGLGGVTGHYGVEGDAFYGIPLSRWLPYVLSRTWHVQLGLFWIVTSWLAAGLFVAPLVGGAEPKGQRLGVNVLFGALLLVVVGSLAGQWLSVMHKLDNEDAWFYFGHSGYEYIDLGRAWQLALWVGLILWLFLVFRAILPALRRRDDQRQTVLLFVLAAVSIAVLYGAALGYGKHTHLSVAEYWRWWVVHLWVEGFFEVFATVVIAFLFGRLGLVHPKVGGAASLLAATIYLSGGIIGMLHHLYFSGTPSFVTGLGAVFSALEVVPLVFIGFDAWHNLRLLGVSSWAYQYRWPVYFFVAVAFWNAVGAGLFGFMINPPVALYYMQGLNTTPVHGHAALFGVYGLLGIALTLFCLRARTAHAEWGDGLLTWSFWLMNGGLMAMIVLSLLPVGLLQTRASVQVGYWYARSPEFLQAGVINTLRWLRVVGDTAFALGAFTFVAFVARLAIKPGMFLPPEPTRAPMSPVRN